MERWTSWQREMVAFNFSYFTTMVGAGFLSLPYDMTYLGWGPGAMFIILSWTIYWNLVSLIENSAFRDVNNMQKVKDLLGFFGGFGFAPTFYFITSPIRVNMEAQVNHKNQRGGGCISS